MVSSLWKKDHLCQHLLARIWAGVNGQFGNFGDGLGVLCWISGRWWMGDHRFLWNSVSMRVLSGITASGGIRELDFLELL